MQGGESRTGMEEGNEGSETQEGNEGFMGL